MKTQVTEVHADRFELTEMYGKSLLAEQGICFYVDELPGFWRFRTPVSSLVAFLPGTDWIVERV
jgi:hypothetical protein